MLIENDIFWYLRVRKVGHLVTRWVTSVFSISVQLTGTARQPLFSVILSRSIYVRTFADFCRFQWVQQPDSPLPPGVD